MSKRYITNHELIDLLHNGKRLYVFGTGVDAEQVCESINIDSFINAFIDNKRFGAGNKFRKKDIISINQYQKSDNHVILIAAGRFYKEIEKQLEEIGYVAGQEFYVWDEWRLFHSDDVVEQYIEFLEKIWKPHKLLDRTNKVLIAFDNRCDLAAIKYGYCANFFAEKYNASIYGYFRFGANILNASPVVKRIYQAVNMVDLVDTSFVNSKEVEEITEKIWKSINSWSDWRQITLFGIHFGTTIIRDFLRTQIPDFDVRSQKMYEFLKKSVSTIVFWREYFETNSVKAVLLGDGVSWDGYIRDIAVSYKIPTYSVDGWNMSKMKLNYCHSESCMYYKKMWNQLTEYEKEVALEWSKKHIKMRIKGCSDEVSLMDKENFSFGEDIKESRILNDNNKIKVIICPHIFEEDCYHCGEQIFDDNYFSWLCHLGGLSDRTPEYEWYLKMHPSSSKRDFIIIDKLLKKYTNIKLIKDRVSPVQLKTEGAKFALSVCGTIGHEYPMIGIQVINAGKNPHENFDFNWNPKTKEEYDDLIFHLKDLKDKNDEIGLIQFYAMHYLVYDAKKFYVSDIFFEKDYLNFTRCEFLAIGKRAGVWMYQEYMENWSEEKHYSIFTALEKLFKELDSWEPDILYRSKQFKELCKR
ncbi:hypothetical protein IMSAGC020_00771 [Lachnospiraceae bacterium]|nr:hypothetical protein IMSAGC020_00771 [Lachnospiraceae bacterium]